MKINTDTESELQDAIDIHKANGWVIVERRRNGDGTWTATLKRTDNSQDQLELKTK